MKNIFKLILTFIFIVFINNQNIAQEVFTLIAIKEYDKSISSSRTIIQVDNYFYIRMVDRSLVRLNIKMAILKK